MKLLVNFSDLRAPLLSALAFILCGAIALPLLPIWEGAIRLVAAMVLLAALPPSAMRKSVCVVFALLGTISLGAWGSNLVQHPFAHIIHALTDVYGQPLTVFSDSALLLFDMMCATGLCCIATGMNWQRDRLVGMYTGSALVFWIWTLFALGVNLLFRGEQSHFAQMITGASGWATWVYWAVLPVFLVRSEADVRRLLVWAGAGGLITGCIVAIQWIVGDFSYVLDAPDLTNYFYRVRGTSYYHAPATYALVLISGVMLALVQKNSSKSKWQIGLAVAFLVGLIFINGTRALSLALLLGSFVVCIGALRQRNYMLLLSAVLVMSFMSSGIFYLKPANVAVESAEAVQSFVQANSDRALLAMSGLKLLPSLLWTGSGIGLLELPLSGTVFNGARCTYSTHVLYLDIILMAGVPALLALLAMCFIAAWRAATDSILAKGRDTNYRALALLAVLVMFSVGCLFLPQERNYLIGVTFLIASLALLRPGKEPAVKQPALQHGWALGMIAFGAVGWAFVTSPAFVFPAVEFVAKHGASVIDNDEQVMTTDPVMKPILQALLNLRGATDAKVLLLPDNVNALPKDNTWVLWSPARDFAYLQLRNKLGYQVYRQGGDAPSVRLPHNWWVLDSSQPIVDTLYVGMQPIISVPIQELGKVELVEGAKPLGEYIEGLPLLYATEDQELYWKVQFNECVPHPFALSIEPEKEKKGYVKGISQAISDNSAHTSIVSIASKDFPPNTKVALTGQMETWPNRAPSAAVKGRIDTMPVWRLADMDYGSGITWDAEDNFSVLFAFSSDDMPRIGVYRMVAMNRMGVALGTEYSWVVEGSTDGDVWKKIDSRSNVMLSHDPSKPSAFVMQNEDSLRYYRITFLASKGELNGISEIELYPVQ
ncbi:O-antigen ligase family protein [Halodesulfovibrio sp.]|jgi:hypothetical protein|uniref:O-antigen ligase family protein n=1 Tax=Halodesulfovibrio sp. TaxID=1912772 RepID=UPI0025F9D423|nr:O-antigen ligase family protein [Halodesulfovibrio sp.]MCT4626535.1 hypothetical protein [Halodesulfovibrio sp.]